MEETSTNLQIGTYLRDLRTKANIDLDSIANKSKISLKVLKKLEDNLLDELPSKTYVKGFVKSYCSIIKIDPSEALSILDKDYETITPDSNQQKLEKTDKNFSTDEAASKIKGFSSNVKLSSFLVFLLPIIGITYFLYSPGSQDSNTEITKTSNSTLARDDKKTTTSTQVKNDSLETKVVISTTTTTKTTTTTTAPIQQVVVTSEEDLPFKVFKDLGRPSYYLGQRSTEFIPKKFRHIRDGFNTVYINADGGSSWIRYKVDDEKIVTKTLRDGANVYLRGNSFYITTGNYNAISIYFNNRFIESSSSKEFRRLIFPVNEYTEHKRPLFINHKKKTYFYMDYMMLMNSL